MGIECHIQKRRSTARNQKAQKFAQVAMACGKIDVRILSFQINSVKRLSCYKRRLLIIFPYEEFLTFSKGGGSHVQLLHGRQFFVVFDDSPPLISWDGSGDG